MADCSLDIQGIAPSLALLGPTGVVHGFPAYLVDAGECIDEFSGMCVPLHIAIAAGLDPLTVMLAGESLASSDLAGSLGGSREQSLIRMI